MRQPARATSVTIPKLSTAIQSTDMMKDTMYHFLWRERGRDEGHHVPLPVGREGGMKDTMYHFLWGEREREREG